jgi:hypothetical protein
MGGGRGGEEMGEKGNGRQFRVQGKPRGCGQGQGGSAGRAWRRARRRHNQGRMKGACGWAPPVRERERVGSGDGGGGGRLGRLVGQKRLGLGFRPISLFSFLFLEI